MFRFKAILIQELKKTEGKRYIPISLIYVLLTTAEDKKNIKEEIILM